MERLRAAAVEGRLTFGELTERTESAYRATTRGELSAVTADLPAPGASAAPAVPGGVPAPSGGRRPRRIVAVLGDTARTGAWRVDEEVRAVAVLGDVRLDLRQAQVPAGEVVIFATSVLGDVKIIVPDGVSVEVTGIAVLGDKKVRVREAPPGRPAPRVRVHATVVLGDVTVVDDANAQPVRKALGRWLRRGDR